MSEPSEGAKKILRHLKAQGMSQMEFEYPAELEKLFDNAKDCEAAEAELKGLGLIELGAGPGEHLPVKNRIRPAALTLEGERYLAGMGSTGGDSPKAGGGDQKK